MSKTNAFEYNLLVHVFNGTAISGINTTGGTTEIWVALNTADPGEAGSTANEGIGGQYTRIAVGRSTSGWAVTSNATTDPATVSPVSAISFPENTDTTTGTYSYASVYTSSNASGANALYTGAISPTINVSQNVTPSLTTASAITEQ